jgi:hypothetical protein
LLSLFFAFPSPPHLPILVGSLGVTLEKDAKKTLKKKIRSLRDQAAKYVTILFIYLFLFKEAILTNFL